MATGTPRKYDWGDVVTVVQLMIPESEQAKMLAPSKWAAVK
jgi:hypothetical protein